jgi:hypothetical protein
MSSLINKFLSYHRKRVFKFAIDDFIGRRENRSVDDQVSPDLASELGVFIVQETGGTEDRVLIVDTDNEVTPEQIIEVFSRHGVSARLLIS